MIHISWQGLSSGLHASPGLLLVAGFACGCVLGLLHFGSLARNVDDLIEGRALRAIALQIVRFLFTGSILFVLARIGALPLVGAAAGLLVGRRLVLKRMARRP